MARKLEHTYGGALASLGVAAISTRNLPPSQAVAESIALALGGALGGRLPDRVEPATGPNHRHFAHSATLGACIALGLVKLGSPLRKQLRLVGSELLASRDLYEEDSWQWLGLGLLSIATSVLAGLAIGIPVGYLSHLGLDHAKSTRGIPLLV